MHDDRTSRGRWWYRNAPYHTGPFLPNFFGLQVGRTLAKRLARRLRPAKASNPDAEKLLRDGVTIIPDFLALEAFAAVRKEYEESRRRLPYQRDMDYAEFVPAEYYERPDLLRKLKIAIEDSTEADGNFPKIREHVVENRRIWDIVEAASRRRLKEAPSARVVSWRSAGPDDEMRSDKYHAKPRGEYMLHADTHYPTFKAWLYLSDVDERNGAFVYVRRSHRLSLERLKYEYDASLRVARSKADGSWFKYPYGHIRRPDDGYLSRLGLKEEAIKGRANSLVIADTSGFHRRGEFFNDAPREVVFLHWRSLDANVLGL